jgi:competence ComEA-like helix-hairpin-helix protein
MKWLSATVVLLVALPLVCCSTLYAKGKREALKEGEKIDINTANATALMRLPGVGEARAEKIISNRPYNSIEDLKTKKIGVGDKAFERWRPYLTCSGAAAPAAVESKAEPGKKAEPEKKAEPKEAAPEMPKEEMPKTE